MPLSGGQPDPQLLILAVEAVEDVLRSLSPQARRFALPMSFYTYDIAHACAQSGPRDPRAFVRRAAREQVLTDAASATSPLQEPAVVEYAIVLANEVFEAYVAKLAPRFGNHLFDLGDALGYAADALIAWGKREHEQRGAIGNMWAYVRTTLRFMIVKDVDRRLRASEPGERAVHHLTRRILKRLREEEPDLSGDHARRRARDEAREQVRAAGGFLERVDDPEAMDAVRDQGDPLAAQGWLLGCVCDVMTSSRYTATDRDTWLRFLQTEFNGADIPWEEAGVSRHAGAQRLFSLLRKLRHDLRDLVDDLA
jgi:hypothetical protein